MTNLTKTMKVLSLILLGSTIISQNVHADVCDDAFIDFATEAVGITEKNMITVDDANFFNNQFTIFKNKIQNEECYESGMNQSVEYTETFKLKRIATLKKYKRMGIREEGGKSIAAELDFLSGNTPVEIEPTVEKPIVAKIVKPAVGKCGDKILENDAVNLSNVRDQDSVGWCYAYTAADLLSYKLNKKISAVSLYDSGQSIEADIKTRDSANGGDIWSSIKNYLAKNKGLCLEEDLPSNDFKFCVDKNYSKFLNNLISVAKAGKFTSEMNNNTCFAQDLEKAFPGAGAPFIKDQIVRGGSENLIESLYDQQCKNLSFPNLSVEKEIQSVSFTPVDELIKSVNSQLDIDNVAAVSYDHKKLNNQKGSEGHASIVVGRRTNPKTGSCDFLIRNSWGKTCTQNESNDISCHKTCDDSGCRYSGNFWVSESRLKDSLTGVTYLK